MMPSKKSRTLYSRVHNLNTLMSGWEVVKKNGKQSQSEKTRKLIEDFENGARGKVIRIQQALKAKNFHFKKSIGVAVEREGKQDRPLVVSPIENRIVQRVLLVILQKEEGIKKLIHLPTSFGGIEKKSVEQALKAVADKSHSGANFYARSDIVSFFTGIPKSIVLNQIFSALPQMDDDFQNLLTKAVDVELENIAALGEEKISLFPLEDIGVAQGSCLSPLLGNIFLNEFDSISNTKDVSCIRFIDDYVILGPTEESVKSVFLKGKIHLKKHGLEVYDPYLKSEKGKCGPLKNSFDFLGCEIQPGRIRPSMKSVERLRKKIKERIFQGLKVNEGQTFVDTVISLRNTIQGWGNSYSFCNDENLMASLDGWLQNEIIQYHDQYLSAVKELENKSDIVRSIGMKYLSDCKKAPIYSGKQKKIVESKRSKILRAMTRVAPNI